MMLGFGVIMTIMIVSGTYALIELDSVSKTAGHILTIEVKSRELARQLQRAVQDESGYIEKYLISEDVTYLSLFKETAKLVKSQLQSLGGRVTQDADKAWVKKMDATHDLLFQTMERHESGEIILKSETEKIKDETIDVLLQTLGIMIANNRLMIQKEMGEIESITSRAVRTMIILMAGSLAVAVIAALVITMTITRPINDLIKGTRQIARGNFSPVHVSSKDEISLLADAVNEMSGKIQQTHELRTHTMHQISHELKTPLQVIQSAHDILKASKAVREDKQKLLDTVRINIDKISDFNRQYLDLARIESGEMKYDLAPCSLPKIAEPVVQDAKLIAREKKIDIGLRADTVPQVMADASKVAIIMNNLICNAVKYTPDNGSVEVKISSVESGVELSVKDTGIGISDAEISNVFLRFYQAGNIKLTKANGSGVGLAIVKAFAEGHKGKVKVRSKIGQGSVFSVIFPFNRKTVKKENP